MLETYCELPCVRALVKNHNRSSADRPADGAAVVVVLDEWRRRLETRRLQLIRVVAALRPLGPDAGIGAAGERVSARLRHDVEHRPARFRLAQAAGDGKGELLCVTGVGDVVRGAALRHRNEQAVEHRPPLAVGTARQERAVRAERAGTGAGLHVARAADDAGHEREERGVATRGRQRGDDLLADHRLLFGALDVDDRSLSGDGNRLLEGTDLQLGVDRNDERARELQPVALEGAEAGQRERDAVDAGPQVLDPVLAGRIGDARPHFLDQFRAGGFDGDAGQHRARGVLDGAGNRCLRVQCGGEEHHERDHREGAEVSTHVGPPVRGRSLKGHRPLRVRGRRSGLAYSGCVRPHVSRRTASSSPACPVLRVSPRRTRLHRQSRVPYCPQRDGDGCPWALDEARDPGTVRIVRALCDPLRRGPIP